MAGVRFIEGDIRSVEFEPGAFDALWSRDSLLHLPDKPALFLRLRSWLEPRGRVLLTDYARSAAVLTPAFVAEKRSGATAVDINSLNRGTSYWLTVDCFNGSGMTSGPKPVRIP